MNTWRVTPHGVMTVARQEFRLRIRAGRWQWLLAAWFVILLAFTALMRSGLDNLGEEGQEIGSTMYGGLMFFVLALALLVVPALTAQSVNGDRERGTLATLQTTLLSPAEIAVGKLVAGWGTALVFLLLTVPFIAWSMAEGGVPLWRVVVTTLVVALLLGVVCAVAQALSALLARSTTSSVLSYLAVFALSIGTVVAFGLALAVTTETVEVTEEVQVFEGESQPEIQEHTFTTTRERSDRVWWLLAPNPFVILADAAPESADTEFGATTDPLGEIGRAVRDLRRPPASEGSFFEPAPGIDPDDPEGAAVWPWGLAANVALGLAAVAVTTRRLRTPSRKIARGVRVA